METRISDQPLYGQGLETVPPRHADSAVRNASLDWLRFLAAVVVVLFHAKAPGGQVVEAALAVFVLATVFYTRATDPLRVFARKRADRLLLPFAFWGVFYAALVVADAAVSGGSVISDLRDWLPPEGSFGQLWFLPFAFLACIAAWHLRPLADSLDTVGFAMVLIGLGIMTIGWHGLWASLGLPSGIMVYGNHLPLIGFGVVLGACAAQGRSCLPVALVAVCVGLIMRRLGLHPDLAYLAGVPLFCAVLLFHRPQGRLSPVATQLSMAVYLIHPFCLALVQRAGAPVGTALGWGTVVASVLLSLLLMRTRLRRLLT